VPSRERAQAMVLSGRVMVDGQKIEKAGAGVDPEAEVRFLGEDLKYVGRGGLKLKRRSRTGKLICRTKVHGRWRFHRWFYDCMLQHGAAEVIAVDTGLWADRHAAAHGPAAREITGKDQRALSDAGETAAAAARQLRSALSPSMYPLSLLHSCSRRYLSPLLCLRRCRTVKSSGADQSRNLKLVRELVGKGGIVKDEQARQNAVLKVNATD